MMRENGAAKLLSEATCVLLGAGGRGHRMGDSLPRVLHEVAGVPVLGHVLKAVESLGARNPIIVGEDPAIEAYVAGRATVLAQGPQRGSGQALLQARAQLRERGGGALVIYGDRVHLEPKSIQLMADEVASGRAAASLLSVVFDKPHGYGRVVRREDGTVAHAVTDCTLFSAEEIEIREVLAGAYFIGREALLALLDAMDPARLGETLMTDVVTWLARERTVSALRVKDPREALGIYSFIDLAKAQSRLQEKIADYWMSEGVRIVDARTTTIDADARIGAGTTIHPHALIEGPSAIGKRCRIGPFAWIRPGTALADGASVAGFAEAPGAGAERALHENVTPI